jgi:hypothetical protein
VLKEPAQLNRKMRVEQRLTFVTIATSGVTTFLWKDGLEGKTGRDREKKGTVVSRALDWSTCAFRDDIDPDDMTPTGMRRARPKAGGGVAPPPRAALILQHY